MSDIGFPFLLLLGFFLAAASSCSSESDRPFSPPPALDPHSFSRPGRVVVKHLELDLTVDFEQKRIQGKASLQIENFTRARELSVDSRDLEVERVTLDAEEIETPFLKGDTVEHLGEPLSIVIQPETRLVHIYYRTSPQAAALQWLEPEQTAGGRHPFLLSQSQAVLARSWIPCQDSPSVRMTYGARIQVPAGLMVVMSAANPTRVSETGLYEFKMPQPIPSYLLAIAVGDLGFQPLGPRTGVYAEPELLEAAAWELADTEKMVAAAEELYGPYRWERYDLIVLPPSFPFGGMENPRLTFLTPTMLAGDRSLVGLIAHELAHSWSGNLVTNSTWNDFWLNEGFTTYFEHRIMESVYGRELEEMLAELELTALRESLEREFTSTPRDTWLHLDLVGRDPDAGMTTISYDKGHFFLRAIEEAVGRERWDRFLVEYFDEYAFQTMDSRTFTRYLRDHLLLDDSRLEEALQIENWIYGPGLPSNCPEPGSRALEQVRAQITAFTAGAAASSLDSQNWTAHHFLYFLRNLPVDLDPTRLADLDRTFHFTRSRNSEILHDWLLLSIKTGYAADPALEGFLTRQGRRKFLLPLYRELARTKEGSQRATKIYRKARPGYHSISRRSVEEILEWSEGTVSR